MAESSDPDQIAEERLVQAFLDGDWAVIDQALRRRLVGIARAVLHDEHEAQDAVQVAMLKAERQRGEFDAGRRALTPWLDRITERTAQDLLRKRRSRVRLAETARLAVPPAITVDDPAAGIESEELARAFAECEKGLGDRSRSMFGYQRAGMNETKIAALIGKPKSTVQGWVQQAREQMRRCLEAKGFP